MKKPTVFERTLSFLFLVVFVVGENNYKESLRTNGFGALRAPRSALHTSRCKDMLSFSDCQLLDTVLRPKRDGGHTCAWCRKGNYAFCTPCDSISDLLGDGLMCEPFLNGQKRVCNKETGAVQTAKNGPPEKTVAQSRFAEAKTQFSFFKRRSKDRSPNVVKPLFNTPDGREAPKPTAKASVGTGPFSAKRNVGKQNKKAGKTVNLVTPIFNTPDGKEKPFESKGESVPNGDISKESSTGPGQEGGMDQSEISNEDSGQTDARETPTEQKGQGEENPRICDESVWEYKCKEGCGEAPKSPAVDLANEESKPKTPGDEGGTDPKRDDSGALLEMLEKQRKFCGALKGSKALESVKCPASGCRFVDCCSSIDDPKHASASKPSFSPMPVQEAPQFDTSPYKLAKDRAARKRKAHMAAERYKRLKSLGHQRYLCPIDRIQVVEDQNIRTTTRGKDEYERSIADASKAASHIGSFAGLQDEQTSLRPQVRASFEVQHPEKMPFREVWHHFFSDIDGRAQYGVLGAPGGDLGVFLIALSAIEHATIQKQGQLRGEGSTWMG